MKRAIRIGIDLDGTLAAYQAEVVSFMNKNYGTSYKLEDVKRDDCYDILGSTVISRALKLRKLYVYSHSLRDIAPVKGAVSAVRLLHKEGHKLFSVTSRFTGFSENTHEWLDKKFGKNVFGKVLFSRILSSYSRRFKAAKYASLSVGVVIEDSSYVAAKCAEQGIRVLLLDYPWNRGFTAKGVTRVKNWEEVLKILKRI